MDNLIHDLYFSKSFCLIGDQLDACYDCKYCRAFPNENMHYNTLPTDINPLFSNIPVVINLFYGDPTLQVKNTKKYLKQLEKAKHKGLVIIITKGKISDFGELNYNLKLHIALSTIGKIHEVDKFSYKNFKENLKCIKNYPNITFSCEFRPIMHGINDDKRTIENVFKLCSKYNLPIGYCGLQASDELKEYWEKHNISGFKAFDGYELCFKKPISEECEKILYKNSYKYNIPIFKKTSCLLSCVHGFEKDYNAHYYRPNELGCNKCVMAKKCSNFKNKQTDKTNFNDIIPFKYNIIYANKHTCMYHDRCKFPSSDCTNIQGYLIQIEEKITSADLRMIKWLTGYTVKADFYESPFLSDKWKC